MATTKLGFCFDRAFPAALVTEFAAELEAGGADDLWVIEDSFYTAGVSLAAAALTVTERLVVGVGVLPALSRHPAVIAMELATLSGLGPGRVVAGIGHGVQAWMDQMGIRPASPTTALRESLTAVRRLLRGEEVTAHGTYVRLDRVRLDQPPREVPLVLAGVRGPRSLAVAGEAADGIVLAEFTSPGMLRDAITAANTKGSFHVAVYTATHVEADRHAARRAVAPWLASAVRAPQAAFAALPYYSDLRAALDRAGPDGLVVVDDEIWADLGAIGDPDDVAAHVEALATAGADRVAFFPLADVDVARRQLRTLVGAIFRR